MTRPRQHLRGQVRGVWVLRWFVVNAARKRIIGQQRGMPFLVLFLFVFPVLLSACAARSAQHAPQPEPVSETGHSQRDQQATTRPSVSSILSPSSPTPTTAFALGQAAVRMRQYERAVAWFEQAVQLDPTNAGYHLWLGRAYGHQARRASAGEQFFLARKVRRHLEKAVVLDPDDIAARRDLMQYYLQAPGLLGGSVAKAQKQAEEIAKRDASQGLLAWQQCQAAETSAQLLEITGPGQ